MYLSLESKYFLPKSSLQIIVNTYNDFNKLNNQYLMQQTKNNATFENSLFHVAHNTHDGLLRSDHTRQNFY